MTRSYMKKCSTLLITIEVQIKATLRCLCTFTRKATIKKAMGGKSWRVCGATGMLYISW
jgi:hypothetical protein